MVIINIRCGAWASFGCVRHMSLMIEPPSPLILNCSCPQIKLNTRTVGERSAPTDERSVAMMIRCTFHRELYDMINFMMNDLTLLAIIPKIDTT